MKSRIVFAMLCGFVVGGFFGMGEAFFWLFQISGWLIELPSLFYAVIIYGFLGSGMGLVWALLSRRLANAVFPFRTVLFSFYGMLYLFSGFYANRLFFPEVKSAVSLLFSTFLTFLWGIAVIYLFKIPVQRKEEKAGRISLWKLLQHASLGLMVVVALALLLPSALGKAFKGDASLREPATRARPNVLLIIMDTTRADRLSNYGYGRLTTPNLIKIAEEGILFEQARTVAPWTLPSHASIFTGLYPSQHGTDRDRPQLGNHLTTMAEFFRSNGYQTAGFSNNPWISRALHFDQGFDFFEEMWWRGRLLNRLAAISVADKLWAILWNREDHNAELTNRDILSWFDEIYHPDRPFFIFINYSSLALFRMQVSTVFVNR